MRCAVAVTVLLTWAAACASDDAVVARDGAVADASIAGPTPPAAPVLTPCAPGYRETGDPARCEPWAETGREASCPPGQHPVPGRGCTEVGHACPAGEWPVEIPDDGRPILYVAADANGLAPGTRSDPMTLTDALRRGPSHVLALAKGRYEGQPVVLLDDVALVGACAAETTLFLAGTPGSSQTVAVTGARTMLRDVTVEGEAIGLLVRGPGADVTVDGVVIDRWESLAVALTADATLRGRGLAIEGPPSGDVAGIEVDGSTVELSELSVAEVADIGLLAYGSSSSVTLSQFVIADVRGYHADPTGVGISIEDGALALAHGAVESCAGTGIYAQTGARVEAEDVTVRGNGGIGLDVWYDSSLSLRRALVSGNRTDGVHVRSSTAVIEDVVIEDTSADELDRGIGLLAYDAPTTVRRVLLRRNTGHGLIAYEAQTVMTAEDVTVEDTRSAPADGLYGRGVTVGGGAETTLTRARVVGSRDVGVVVGLRGASLTAEDLFVSSTEPAACSTSTCACCGGGFGMAVLGGASITARSFVVDASASAGVIVLRGGTIESRERRRGPQPHRPRPAGADDRRGVDRPRRPIHRHRDEPGAHRAPSARDPGLVQSLTVKRDRPSRGTRRIGPKACPRGARA